MAQDVKYKTPRTVPELQQAYTALCTRAGDLQYKIFGLEQDLKLVNEELREVNLEGAAAIGREMEAKAKEASEAKAKSETEAAAAKPKLAAVPNQPAGTAAAEQATAQAEAPTNG